MMSKYDAELNAECFQPSHPPLSADHFQADSLIKHIDGWIERLSNRINGEGKTKIFSVDNEVDLLRGGEIGKENLDHGAIGNRRTVGATGFAWLRKQATFGGKIKSTPTII